MKLTKIFGIVLSLHVGVILLVMFQPSCQMSKKKASTTSDDSNKEVSSGQSPDAGFNAGLKSDNSNLPVIENPEPEKVEFTSPTRPSPGELIVPGQDNSRPRPLPPILPDADPLSPSVGLRPTDVSVYKVERGDTLWGIARKKGISLSSLLSSNPNLDKNKKLSIGQEIMIPDGSGSTSSAIIKTTPEPLGSSNGLTSGSTYVVKAGDSLSRIARTQGVSLNGLMSLNGLSSTSIIRIGQVLQLPDSASTTSVAPISPIQSVVPSGASTYTVQKGDNLTRISSIHGTSVRQIMEWNGLSDPGKIRVGQVLIVSGDEGGLGQSTENDSPTPVIQDSEPTDGSSVEGFFKDVTEDRPIINVSEDNP